MSHFNVVVIGQNWEKQLEPFQEQGSRNIDLKYLVWEDKEQEMREKFEKETRPEFFCSSSSSWGQIVSENIFAKLRGQSIGRQVDLNIPEKTGFNGYWKAGKHYHVGVSVNGKYPKERLWVFVNKVLETAHLKKDMCLTRKIQVVICDPPKELSFKTCYETFDQFAKDWCGMTKDLKKQRYGYWINPNAKWDRYEMGGRWSGFFKSKVTNAVRGNPGFMGSKDDFNADQLKLKDIDFEGMRAFRITEAEEQYRKFYQVLGDLPLPPKWSDVLKKHGENVDAAQEEYGNLPVVKRIREVNMDSFDSDIAETYDCILEEFKRRAADRVAVPFAVVKDGKWFERGSMGWWGCVSDAKDQGAWNAKVQKLYASLSPETLLTCVDCHI